MRALRRAVAASMRRLGLWPRAVDEASASRRGETPSSPGPVDVIVPVHGGGDAVRACFVRLFAHTDFAHDRLIVVVDGDPDFRADALAPPPPPAADVVVLRHDTCRGFVYSVNRGMSYSDRDVVLLNSDTIVTRGWLRKLQAAAYSAPAVATATPFSNNATICSLPRPLIANPLPPGYDVDRFACLVEEAAEPSYPHMPTGVGMCLYIKRQALDALGLFDDDSFGPGYGEENDFAMRALKAGWTHVLDDATFIYHEGQQSFGVHRAARVAAAERTLRRLHPEYRPTIARFLAADPLADARQRVVAALAAARPQRSRHSPRRVLHVVHGWPPYNHAGTELYAFWLVELQRCQREVAVYARIDDPRKRLGDACESLLASGLRTRLVVNNFSQRDPLSRNALHNHTLERDFDRFLVEVDPDLIHIHHLAGHSISLLGRAARRRLPLVYQIQDWWPLCARSNLFDADDRLCVGPAPRRCSRCLPMTGVFPAPLWNPLLHRYRFAAMRRALRHADAYVMGSRFIEQSYREAGFLRPTDDVHVLTYGIDVPQLTVAPGDRGEVRSPLRCGYIGSILPHKGVHVAVEAFRDLSPAQATLELWGDARISPSYTQRLQELMSPGVILRGNFAEEEKAGIFARIDVLLVPSLGLESFGLVAREALARGVPVIASRRGALVELFPKPGGGGAFFEAGNADALRRLLVALLERPQTLVEWQQAIPPVVTCDEHAAAIEEVYERVLARRAS